MEVIWLPGPPGREAAPAALQAAELLEQAARRLRGTEGADGGLRKPDLLSAVLSSLSSMEFISAAPSPLPGEELDLVVDGTVGVSVQTGRAWSNNGALAAAISAAATPGLEWLVLVVPSRYKTSSGVDAKVIRQLRAVAAAEGVDLDLQAVLVASF